LYRRGLLDPPDVPSFHWMFDAEDHVGVANELQINCRGLQQKGPAGVWRICSRSGLKLN
jgi:hypothetical protein